MSPGPERRLEELREELSKLMLEQVQSLKKQTFGGLDSAELRKQDERLNRIREKMIDIEHLSDAELQRLAEKYQKVREECDVRSRRSKK
jgi:hypothetical protein